MSKHKDRTLAELVEDAVDKGATTVEEIHRSIADLPIKVLEDLGVFEKTAKDVRNIQEASIGAIYDVIRDVNHSVGKLAADILDEGGDAHEQGAPAPRKSKSKSKSKSKTASHARP